MLLLSTPQMCFAAHFFQYTDRELCIRIFLKHLSDKATSCQFFSSLNINVCHCGHLKPRSRFHTSLLLNLANLLHPSFFLLVTSSPCPYPFCPKLSGYGGSLIFHLQAVYFHEHGQGGRALFSCRSCHLSPQFQPLRGRHPNRMAPSLAGIMPARNNFLTACLRGLAGSPN